MGNILEQAALQRLCDFQNVLQRGNLAEAKYLVDNFLPQDSDRTAFYEAIEEARKRYAVEEARESGEGRNFQSYLAEEPSKR